MRLLLEHGADANIATFGGTTPLMAAAGVNWTVSQTFDEGPEALLEAVRLAHSLGNDVNARTRWACGPSMAPPIAAPTTSSVSWSSKGALDVADARGARR